MRKFLFIAPVAIASLLGMHSAAAPNPEQKPLTIEQACAQMLAHAISRNAPSTLYPIIAPGPHPNSIGVVVLSAKEIMPIWTHNCVILDKMFESGPPPNGAVPEPSPST